MDSEIHIRGKECKECCCHKYIHENCGGYLHCRLVDDTEYDGYVHNYKCDKCNEEDYGFGYYDYKIEFKD